MQKIADLESLARPFYGDGSHGWNHIQDVLSHARQLKGAPLTEDETAAVMFHDSSLTSGPRETHADDSAAIARRVLGPLMAKRRVERIAKAIARHRASYKGRRYTFLDDLLSSADRNDPDDIRQYFDRSLRWGLENGLSDREAIDNAFEHIPAKYGRGGYAFSNAPRLYMKANRAKLERAWDEIARMSKADLAKMLEGIKAEG